MMAKPLIALVTMCQHPSRYLSGLEDDDIRFDIERVNRAISQYLHNDRCESIGAEAFIDRMSWISLKRRISLWRTIGKEKGKVRTPEHGYELTPCQKKALDISMDVLELGLGDRHPSRNDPPDHLFSSLPWNAPGRQLRQLEWEGMVKGSSGFVSDPL